MAAGKQQFSEPRHCTRHFKSHWLIRPLDSGSPMAKLLIKAEGSEDRVLELRLGANRIGRAEDNHFQISHPSVSKHHCELLLGDGTVTLRDCRSARGCYVNGRRVKRANLRAGQTLRLGEIELFVESIGVTVAIPQYERPNPFQPDVRSPVPPMHCERHPALPVNHECTQCRKLMCGICVKRFRVQDRMTHLLCPYCSRPVRMMEEPKPPVVLSDGAMLCNRHQRSRATHQCSICKEVMCLSCVQWLRVGRGKLRMLCPLCTGPVEIIRPAKRNGKGLGDLLKQSGKLAFLRGPTDS